MLRSSDTVGVNSIDAVGVPLSRLPLPSTCEGSCRLGRRKAIQGLGFRVQGSRFGVWGSGVAAQSFGVFLRALDGV